MQFSGENGQNNTFTSGGCAPVWEILDPPLDHLEIAWASDITNDYINTVRIQTTVLLHSYASGTAFGNVIYANMCPV